MVRFALRVLLSTYCLVSSVERVFRIFRQSAGGTTFHTSYHSFALAQRRQHHSSRCPPTALLLHHDCSPSSLLEHATRWPAHPLCRLPLPRCVMRYFQLFPRFSTAAAWRQATGTATPWPRHKVSSPTPRRCHSSHRRRCMRQCRRSRPRRRCRCSPLPQSSERGMGGTVGGEGRLPLGETTGTGTAGGYMGMCLACQMVD